MARPRNPASPVKMALARAAREIACQRGAEALTVRAAASAAGVSPNAPYSHFPGGTPELIAVAAIAGFAELRESLNRPLPPTSGTEGVRELVLSYVEFGVRNANLYRAMFHQRIAEPLESESGDVKGEATYAELRQLKLLAYEDVVAPLTRLALENGLRRGQDPRDAPGLALAALAHGLVGEFIDEGLLRPVDSSAPWTEERRLMTAEVTDVMLLGLLDDLAPARLEATGGTEERLAPEDDPSWRLYRETILEFFPGGRTVSIDLRRPVSEHDLAQLYERGLPGRFAVFTGCNPRGRPVPDVENARRDRALKERLRADGQMWVPVDGVSPDGRHRETGVAVGLSREHARRMARDFGQSAIYWFDGGAFWIVGALVEGAPTRLPANSAFQSKGSPGEQDPRRIER